MSDSLRTDADRDVESGAIADRAARIEQLLLTGLDHYFAGEFERAINVWSRVVFLDRQHSRARAYIDRARSKLAERLRESEELLHRGVAAFDCGDTTEARTLINQAVEHVGPNDMALMLLDRLNRLDPATPLPEPVGRGRVPATAAGSPRTRASAGRAGARQSSWLVVIGAVVAASAALLLAGAGLGMWFADRPGASPEATVPGAAPLPVARASDTALARARQLSADGRLREALRMLDTVAAEDPQRAAADDMRSQLQRRILDGIGAEAQR